MKVLDFIVALDTHKSSQEMWQFNTHPQFIDQSNKNWFFLSLISDCELEELESTPRYRPDSLAQICKTTKFSEVEIKRMYRGFKAHCPNGVVKEDTFKIIYAQFFPQGGKSCRSKLYK